MLTISIENMSNMTVEELKRVLDVCNISRRNFALKLWNQIHERKFLVNNLEVVLKTARKNVETLAEQEAKAHLQQFARELDVLNNIFGHFEKHLNVPNIRPSKSAAARLIERYKKPVPADI